MPASPGEVDSVAREEHRELMHTASWQRGAVITGVVWGLLMSLVATTWSHSDLDPRQSIPNKWETYTLNVPTETAVPTVQVRLLVPREFEVEMLEHSQVWQISKTRDERGYIREVLWSGSTIPPQTFAALKLVVRNPATPGTYVWKIEQSYQDSTVATWEAQTQIASPTTVSGAQRAEEAWRAAQVATTVSLVAIGIAVLLIIVTVLGIVQGHRGRVQEHQS